MSTIWPDLFLSFLFPKLTDSINIVKYRHCLFRFSYLFTYLTIFFLHLPFFFWIQHSSSWIETGVGACHVEKGIPSKRGSIAKAQRSWEDLVCLDKGEKSLWIEARVWAFYMGGMETKRFCSPYLNGNLVEYRILGWYIFSFSTLKILSCSLFVSIVIIGKYFVNLVVIP